MKYRYFKDTHERNNSPFKGDSFRILTIDMDKKRTRWNGETIWFKLFDGELEELELDKLYDEITEEEAFLELL